MRTKNALAYSGGYSIRDYVFPRRNQENGNYEKHAPFGNYIGPNTDVLRRIREGVKPTTETDAAAQRHDIAYYTIRQGLRKQTLSIPMAKEKTREADNRLLTDAKRNLRRKFGHPVEMAHASAALAGIGSKEMLEDAGILDPLKFIGKGKIKDPLKKLRKEMTRKQKN